MDRVLSYESSNLLRIPRVLEELRQQNPVVHVSSALSSDWICKWDIYSSSISDEKLVFLEYESSHEGMAKSWTDRIDADEMPKIDAILKDLNAKDAPFFNSDEWKCDKRTGSIARLYRLLYL